MSLQIGIVGLPNVGKSTLFNALIRGAKADAQNYPFCTIEPNVGIVEVPDERLAPLSKISNSKKTVPAAIEFVDIAGLVKGASKGEGLGNQFLAHIREVDAILMVVRFFEDDNVTHVEGKINPESDIEVLETELQLADIATVEKRLYSVEKEIRGNSKDAIVVKSALQKLKDVLHAGKNARVVELTKDEKDAIKGLSLLTSKPILYIANCSEEQLQNFDPNKLKSPASPAGGYKLIPISAKIEEDLNELSDEDKKEYLKEIGAEDTGLNRLIKEAYKTLGLITFLTSEEQETRAWTVREGAKAPEAAGVIHTDFERGFIAADVIPWQDLYQAEGWPNARAKGRVKMEGKEYVVKDGDVILFKFNV